MCLLFITTKKKKKNFNRTSYIIFKTFTVYVSNYIICKCAYVSKNFIWIIVPSTFFNKQFLNFFSLLSLICDYIQFICISLYHLRLYSVYLEHRLINIRLQKFNSPLFLSYFLSFVIVSRLLGAYGPTDRPQIIVHYVYPTFYHL